MELKTKSTIIFTEEEQEDMSNISTTLFNMATLMYKEHLCGEDFWAFELEQISDRLARFSRDGSVELM